MEITKKKTLIFLISLFLISPAFSLSDRIELESNHPCTDREINFHLYDWESKDEDQDEFNSSNAVDAEIIIHDGPISGAPIVKETSTNSSGGFSYHFEEENTYLIRILPDNDDLEEKDKHFTVSDCESRETEEDSQDTYNSSYSKNNYTITFTNSNYEEPKINIYEDNLSEFDAPTDTKFIISSNINDSFDYDEIVFSFENNKDIFYLSGNHWEMLEENVNYSKSRLDINDYETLAILGHDPESEPQTNSEEEVVEEDIQQDVEQVEEEESMGESIQEQFQPEDRMPFIIGIIIFLIFIILSAALYTKKNKEKIEKEDHSPENIKKYNDLLTKTKRYISQHKYSYSTKSIKESLKEAGVPDEIIEKAMDDELG